MPLANVGGGVRPTKSASYEFSICGTHPLHNLIFPEAFKARGDFEPKASLTGV